MLLRSRPQIPEVKIPEELVQQIASTLRIEINHALATLKGIASGRDLKTFLVLYEKYDDQVDAFGEKALAELKRQYVVFDAKVLSKIPRGPLKDKKLSVWDLVTDCFHQAAACVVYPNSVEAWKLG
ncbi:hypothetical protein Leryth_019326 [Lithospermum erythrorhizon]|nr:hypothetical protein Leryth_019326 [Lithospermum erythrorhizon]